MLVVLIKSCKSILVGIRPKGSRTYKNLWKSLYLEWWTEENERSVEVEQEDFVQGEDQGKKRGNTGFSYVLH